MKKGIIIGALLIFTGIGLFAYYDIYVSKERRAEELLTKGKIIYERGTRGAINDSINYFSDVIARYPDTNARWEAEYYIAQSYEKLNLNRLAFLKYLPILKHRDRLSPRLMGEVKARLARLKVMRRYTEEGIHQLLGLLTQSGDRDFRSRVYTELGHAYLKMQTYKKAKRMFDIALTEHGDNEEAILGKASTLKRLGHLNDAYDTYEYYLTYYGNFSHYADDVRHSYIRQVYQSGHQSYRKGRHYESISFFKRILRFFPGHKKSENCLYWIGECYFAMKKYDSAIKYFSKTLGNSYIHKNQVARIKKGYSYFLTKRFDMAAREFQIYLNAYPNGRFANRARKWKEMSTKEILYQIQNKMIPEMDDEDLEEDAEDEGSSYDLGSGKDKKIEGFEDIEYENIAEL